MIETSATYREILAGDHRFELRVAIGEDGVLVDESGDTLVFGTDSILIDTGAPEDGYDESMLLSVRTGNQIFSQEPGAGATCAGEVDIDMVRPVGDIPLRARIGVFVRAVNSSQTSEWIPQGVFYIDSREELKGHSWTRLTLHGYDAMLLTEADYPENSTLSWPASDTAVVDEIADRLNLTVDDRVYRIMNAGYPVNYPAEYSCREVLGYIGAMYAGNWIITGDGSMMLVTIGGLPKETRLLIDEAGDSISFGGDCIIV